MMKNRYGTMICGILGAAIGMFLLAGCGPSTAEKCLKAGAERGANGNWRAALKMANRAAVLEPESVSALILRAVAYDALGERDLALDAARQAATRNPENFAAQYTLGRLYAEESTRYPDALRALTRAATLSKFKDRDTLVLLSNTLVAQRSPSAATWLEMLRRADASIVSDPAFQNLLGIAQARANRKDAAQQAFTKAYQLDRQNPMIVYNIGAFFDRHASNQRNAAQFYRAFLRLAGDDPDYATLTQEVSTRLTRMR